MPVSVILLCLVMVATLLTLVTGLVLMARGGKINKKYSNKLMVARVVLQTAAIILVTILFLSK